MYLHRRCTDCVPKLRIESKVVWNGCLRVGSSGVLGSYVRGGAQGFRRIWRRRGGLVRSLKNRWQWRCTFAQTMEIALSSPFPARRQVRHRRVANCSSMDGRAVAVEIQEPTCRRCHHPGCRDRQWHDAIWACWERVRESWSSWQGYCVILPTASKTSLNWPRGTSGRS